MVLLYLRYIDGIFIIWNEKKEQLITFINKLNKKHKKSNLNTKFHSKKSHP